MTTAPRIASPSMEPSSLSSSNIRLIPRLMNAHTIRIFITKSSRVSRTISQKVLGGRDRTLFIPKALIRVSTELLVIPFFLSVFNPSKTYFSPPLLKRKSTSSHLFLYYTLVTHSARSSNVHPYSFYSGDGLLIKSSISLSSSSTSSYFFPSTCSIFSQFCFPPNSTFTSSSFISTIMASIRFKIKIKFLKENLFLYVKEFAKL